eukprot:jgi/Astpho2/4182/Aster-x1205
MPALVFFGRRWHMASDMLPIPGICGAVVHVIWIIVFGALVGRYKILSEDCVLKTGARQGGIQLQAGAEQLPKDQVVAGAFMAIYAASLLGEIALTWVGFQGTPLEVRKRRAATPLLYVMTVLWILQVVFMIYGTVVAHTVYPSCWDGSYARYIPRVIKAMVYSTWIFSVLLALCLLLIYNAYPDHDKVQNWERRCGCVAHLCGCYKTMTSKVEDRAAPLPSIAQWVSGIMGGIDLAPSDITCALVLAAAAQQRRRRMRIKRALEPVLERATTDLSSTVSKSSRSVRPTDMDSDIDDETDVEDESDNETEVDSKVDVETEGSVMSDDTDNAPNLRDVTMRDGELTPTGTEEAPVALPANYPEKWRQAATTQYQDAAEAMEAGQLKRPSSTPSSHPSNPSSRPSHPQVPDSDKCPLPSRQDIEMANRAQVEQDQKGPPSATSEAASDGHGDPEELSKDRRPSGSPRTPPVKNNSGPQLSKHTDGMETGVLDDDSASACSIGDTPFAALANQPLSPLSGHSSPGAHGVKVISLADLSSGMLNNTEEAHAAGQAAEHQQAAARAESFVTADEARDTVAPLDTPPQTGLLQKGLNEPGGLLGAPSELSLANVTKSGRIVDNHGVPIRESGDPELQRSLELQAGPARSRLSLEGVPLERQISVKFPTIITPSAEAEQIRIDIPGVSAQEAAQSYVGDKPPVDLETLEEALEYTKYAVAVYAVQTLTDRPDRSRCARAPCTCGLCAGKVITSDSITSEIMQLTGLPEEDVLFWSHDNTALTHIPYMICLDRKLKKIILALRGTMTVADLVTDAVCHPEPLDSWLPDEVVELNERLRNAFGHGGMVSAAENIFRDLDENGILRTLIHGADYNSQSEELTGQGVGAKMERALDARGYGLVVTGHSLGAGTAALISLKLKERFPGKSARMAVPV